MPSFQFAFSAFHRGDGVACINMTMSLIMLSAGRMEDVETFVAHEIIFFNTFVAYVTFHR